MSNSKIIQQEQMIARLERQLAREKIKQRKADTRKKIEFGGLVVKAKLDDMPKDIILGALIRIKEAIDNEPGSKALYQSIGQAAFMGYGEDYNANSNPTTK